MKQRATTIDNIAAVTVIVIATILAIWLFAGCETVEHEDGTTTTRWDADATRSILDTGFSTYDRYQQYQRPAHEQRLYHQGQVIPAPYPQVQTHYP